MKNMTAQEAGEWYGNRLRNLILYTDRGTLELPEVQRHLAMLAELGNLFISISQAEQHTL